jgi:hypothetical protein
MGRVGGGEIGHLVLGDEADEGLGIARAPALNRHDALLVPLLVGGDGAGDDIGIVDRVDIEQLAVDAAVFVDVVARVDLGLAVLLADHRGVAGEVDEVADRDVILCRRASGEAEDGARGQ